MLFREDESFEMKSTLFFFCMVTQHIRGLVVPFATRASFLVTEGKDQSQRSIAVFAETGDRGAKGTKKLVAQ